MNILFLTPAFPPFPGGGERYAFSLAIELIRRGHAVTVLTSSAKSERDFWQGVSDSAVFSEDPEPNLKIIRCPIQRMPGGHTGLLAWRKMMVLLSMVPGDQSGLLMRLAGRIPAIVDYEATLNSLEPEFDVVQVFNLSWEFPMTVGWQYTRQHHLPLVVIPYTHFGVEGQDRVARNSTMDHQMEILGGAAAVLTLTTIEEKGLVDLGLDGDRVTVIHGGLDSSDESAAAGGDFVGLDLQQPYALFLGRASFDKGAIHAVEAICRYNAENEPLRLILAGQSTPEFERFYEKRLSEEKEWIRPIGLVSEAQKEALLAGCEMLLLPSRADSFGIVLLEAWAYGKAVIGAKAGGIPGVIDDGKNGLLVEFGDLPGLVDSIRLLTNDPARKAKLGQAGLEKANRVYRWEMVGERVEAVYKQVAGK